MANVMIRLNQDKLDVIIILFVTIIKKKTETSHVI